MSRVAVYRKYPSHVRDAIRRTGNPNLFPKMKIPRTTALYWMRRGPKGRFSSRPEEGDGFVRALEIELRKKTALLELSQKIRSIESASLTSKNIKNKETRKNIVVKIKEAMKSSTLVECLEVAKLSMSTYRRWSQASSACLDKEKGCAQRQPGQLTDLEILKMKKFVESKRFAHFSIYSLHLHAQRTGELFSSVNTWYKYVHAYDWRRPRVGKIAKVYKKGLRALRPNEIWHLDVTYISISGGQRVYLQVVIDNYSRYIVAWKLTDEIGGFNTVLNLESAIQTLPFNSRPEKLVSDGGTENTNHRVAKFLMASNIKRVVARQDIRASNSLVEAFFRSLKNNYLRSERPTSYSDLERKLNFYIEEYNARIPHTAFKGATPKELFLNQWTDGHLKDLKNRSKEARSVRLKYNRRSSCCLETQSPFG